MTWEYRGLKKGSLAVTRGYRGLQGVVGLCLSKIDREKVFAEVLDRKEAFKDYNNNSL